MNDNGMKGPRMLSCAITKIVCHANSIAATGIILFSLSCRRGTEREREREREFSRRCLR